MNITKEMLERDGIEASINGHDVKIEVMPQMGANLCSFIVDGKELIHCADDEMLDAETMRGCFHMFPTPCRLPDGKYSFQGKDYVQMKGGKPVVIHGLLRDEKMEIAKGNNTLTASVDITPSNPIYEGYPFPCTFALEYKLIERGVEIRFTYQNTGNEDAPFGYGLHPFWKITGERKDTAVQVPCSYLMELANLVPTGEIISVEGNLDLRKPTSLEGVDIDNLFWDRDKSSPALIEYRAEGKKLVLEASNIFNHMIAFAPAGNPFVCVEFLTCAPNQINLYKGPENDVSGLIIAPPNAKVEGWVRYVLTDL